MVAGLSIVNTHNVWIVDWTLIVTVFGWALVLGGASRIIAPQVVSGVGSSMMGRPTMTRVIGTFWAWLGAFLMFKVYARQMPQPRQSGKARRPNGIDRCDW